MSNLMSVTDWFAECLRTPIFPRFANPGPPSPENMGDVDFDADMKRILDRCAVGADIRKQFLGLGTSSTAASSLWTTVL